MTTTYASEKRNTDKPRVGGDSTPAESNLVQSPEPLSSLQRARISPTALSNRDVLQLQKSVGNHAVRNMLAGSRAASAPSGGMPALSGGLPAQEPEEENHQVIGGATFGEMLGDIGRPVGAALGNVVSSAAGALTGVTISSANTTAPNWKDHGDFEWIVGFTTSGTSGWIVQEINNTYRAEDAAGTALPDPGVVPRYWEAWAVDGTSKITPSNGANHDYWLRPSRGNNTQGHWSMSGALYFTATDPATQGFTAGGVANAGILLSSTTAPSGLGVARQHRYAQGTWDSTGATPTHTGSAT